MNLIKAIKSKKLVYFAPIMIILCFIFIGAAIGKIDYNPEDFGSSKSEPIETGFFFYEGKYIDAPYVVERRGLDVYINDILVRPGPISLLYDYSVDTDPGDPPPGVSPFDPAPEGGELRDNYYSKKWRYLKTHYDFETAKNMIFDLYKNCTELDNVHWSGPNVISVLDKKIGFEIGINLVSQTRSGVSTKPDDLIERMENTKKALEKRLQNDVLFIEQKELTITLPHSKVVDYLKILLSDVSDSKKFRILDEGFIPGCQEEFPWIVMDFEASSQLQERVDSLEKKNIANKIAMETSHLLNNRIFAPTLDSTNLEEETTTQSPNNVTVSIGQTDNSPNNLSPIIDNIKTISQIENSSNSSKRIIAFSLISMGIISLLALHAYRRMHIK